MINAKLLAEGVTPAEANTNANNPAGVDNLAANAVLVFRHSDHANLYADTPAARR